MLTHLVLAVAVLGLPTVAAAEDVPYGDTIVVSLGQNEHSKIPVTLELPAPADGQAVTKVTYTWSQRTPAMQTLDTGRLPVPTPHCTSGVACVVETVVPTARMVNGTPKLTIAVTGEGFLGATSRTLSVQNPKPTVAFTTPTKNYETLWGETTLAADAAPGDAAGAAALRGVRFYLRSGGFEDEPYLFDDTAPYAVDVEALDIASAGAQGTIYAVAEDLEGNLSSWFGGSPDPRRRTVYVGPPPVVAWETPHADDRVAGSVEDGLLLGWSASVPAIVPDSTAGPFIKRVEILADGQPWYDMPYEKGVVWNNFTAGRKLREAAYNHWVMKQSTPWLTAGRHEATLRVTTSYGSVAARTLRFIVSDGVRFGDVRRSGLIVRDGHIVTAGTRVVLSVPVQTKVAGSPLSYADVLFGTESLAPGWNLCDELDWMECPEQVTLRGEWYTPTTPGTYVVRFEAQAWADPGPTSIRREFKVQPAARLGISASRYKVRAGDPVTIRGRVVRKDTGRGVADVPVRIQWRKAARGSQWTLLTTRTSDAYGRVTGRFVRRATGYYRLVSPGVLGKIGPSRSAALKVTVRR